MKYFTKKFKPESSSLSESESVLDPQPIARREETRATRRDLGANIDSAGAVEDGRAPPGSSIRSAI